MLNQSDPKEYILGSGETHSVKEFIDLACKYAGLNNTNWIIDENIPENTKLMCNEHVIIKISNRFYRPAEIDILLANPDATYKELNWYPKSNFDMLVKKMIMHDINI